jgi:hypothetical protein
MAVNKLVIFGILMLKLFWGNIICSQSIYPQSVNSGGTRMNHAIGSVSFIIGELPSLRLKDNDGNTLQSGFTAGVISITTNNQETTSSAFNLLVYPNPTNEYVTIKFDESKLDKIFVSITNFGGQKIYEDGYSCSANTISINFISYPSGNYLLSLHDKNRKLVASYVISKL